MDTIFAPATPPGRSGVAVLRVSGADTSSLFEVLHLAPPTPRMATLARLYHPDSGDLIDEALMLWFPAPGSFTGEDVLEFHLHGGRVVMRRMLDLLSAQKDFRLAEPGEFSRRAFYHGKMDLTRAEAIADLIDAETLSQQRQAARQMQGALATACTHLRRDVIAARAHLEAYLDFPDEDIPEDVAAGLEDELVQIEHQIGALLGDAGIGEKIRDGWHAVLLGIPNAGKSTLMNALARREVAIVSAEAGTTRDIIEVHLDVDGYALTLADTAGLRETEGAIEAEGIRRAHAKAADADLRLIVLDVTVPPQDQRDLLALKQPDDVLIINKTDQETLYLDEYAKLPDAIPLSAATQSGMELLISAIKMRMQERLTGESDALITRARHRNAFLAAQHHLSAARHAPALELKGEELRLAAHALGTVIGAVHIEDVLDVVFSSFCIGK